MNHVELLHLADCNLAELCREQVRYLPPYALDERPYALFAAGNTRFPAPPANCVLPLSEARVEPEQCLDEAAEFFRARERGFGVYAPTHLGGALARACQARSWPQLADPPGMVLSERLPPRAADAAVTLRDVRSEVEAAHFVDVCADAYEAIGLPGAVSRKLWSQHALWLQRPYLLPRVLYDHDRPVSAALLLFSHGIAGVYWVGTIAEARGRGHASTLMRSISNAAFDAGARCVILQATPFGEPVYRKLGYREFTRYPWYLAAK